MTLATFLELARSGAVRPDEVESFVERWHAGEGEASLREFLGLTAEEYARWLRDADALLDIIGVAAGRRTRKRAGA